MTDDTVKSEALQAKEALDARFAHVHERISDHIQMQVSEITTLHRRCDELSGHVNEIQRRLRIHR